MSLTVSPELLAAAEAGPIDDAEFVACIKSSLPYAYAVVGDLAAQLPQERTAGREYADNRTPPPDDATQGQVLRAMASTSIRAALERHFGVAIAFQNCHRVAVFPVGVQSSQTYQVFTSPRAQLLNQSPELVNC
jgi:hypothetical protein